MFINRADEVTGSWQTLSSRWHFLCFCENPKDCTLQMWLLYLMEPDKKMNKMLWHIYFWAWILNMCENWLIKIIMWLKTSPNVRLGLINISILYRSCDMDSIWSDILDSVICFPFLKDSFTVKLCISLILLNCYRGFIICYSISHCLQMSLCKYFVMAPNNNHTISSQYQYWSEIL